MSRANTVAAVDLMARAAYIPASQPIQAGLIAALCNRLGRALASDDPVGAGYARGALARVSLQHQQRSLRARCAYQRTAGEDA
ncbi:MAG TPA: hypothetical protein VFZ66_05845 [Herpetosiphonaceae bacterium]